MSQLARLRRWRRGDRGAVAALVAVMLSGGVLLGAGALTVDVGVLYLEREELQSGADAAALAVAKVCSTGNDDVCHEIAMNALATRYAGDNAKDGASAAVVCGRVRGNAVPPCSAGATNLTGCIGAAPLAPEPYVEVRTSTVVPGEPALPPVFAGAVTGTDGATVGACSRVTWRPVTEAHSEFAIAVSMCDFMDATDDGRTFQPPPDVNHYNPGYAPGTDPAAELALRWRAPTDTGCRSNGTRMPSGFGFLPLTGPGPDTCERSLRSGEWYDLTTTPSSPADCGERISELHNNLVAVVVAVVDEVRLISGRYQAHVAGLAVFVITGWWRPVSWPGGPLQAHKHPPDLNPHMCGEDTDSPDDDDTLCVYGYFTTGLIRLNSGTSVAPGGTPYFGAYYLRTIG